MTELLPYIGALILLLVGFAGLFIYGRKRPVSFEDGDNKILNDQLKDLSDKFNNLQTKIEVEQTKISDNFKGSTEGLKQFLQMTAKNLEDSSSKSTSALMDETRKLTNILQDNSKRGAWAEKIAEDLLKSMGMIEGKSYIKQGKLDWKSEDDKDLKPDFTFTIDGQEKIFIMDSKFPLSNYNKMYDENGNPVPNIEEEKKAYLNAFRKRIDEVNKYINTSENTLDMAAMFIPIATILDETLQMDDQIVDYAMKQKVVLLSPASFYALISFLKHSETLFKVTKSQGEIIKTFTNLRDQWSKYETSFEQVENRLKQLSESIENVKTTRTKAMTREIKRVDDILSLNSDESKD